MIEIKDKKDCCGCHACQQTCPHGCITMQADKEGFLYPVVDKSNCIECGRCEKVCPSINPYDESFPIQIKTFIHSDEKVRSNSSSGGFFSMLATYVLEKGGVVFGARFDEHWNVFHDYIRTKEQLPLFQGSKYLQSTIGDSYIKAEKFLKEGVVVLFTGTSCQIAGLKTFLRKEYESLLTMDVICHGVPSPIVWNNYLQSIASNKVSIKSVSFRDKTTGWKNFSFALAKMDNSLFAEPFTKNLYMKGFLNNFYLRPSCYYCPAKKGKANSDFTVGDFWGVDKKYPELDDDKGISIVLINSDKGYSLYKSCSFNGVTIPYADVVERNRAIEIGPLKEWYNTLFWYGFAKKGVAAIDWLLNIKYKASKIKRLYYKIIVFYISKFK
jgi:coenzyme F420-reducing hydrogenase beta subunit